MLSRDELSDQVSSSWSPPRAPVYADASDTEASKTNTALIFIQTDSCGI